MKPVKIPLWHELHPRIAQALVQVTYYDFFTQSDRVGKYIDKRQKWTRALTVARKAEKDRLAEEEALKLERARGAGSSGTKRKQVAIDREESATEEPSAICLHEMPVDVICSIMFHLREDCPLFIFVLGTMCKRFYEALESKTLNEMWIRMMVEIEKNNFMKNPKSVSEQWRYYQYFNVSPYVDHITKERYLHDRHANAVYPPHVSQVPLNPPVGDGGVAQGQPLYLLDQSALFYQELVTYSKKIVRMRLFENHCWECRNVCENLPLWGLGRRYCSACMDKRFISHMEFLERFGTDLAGIVKTLPKVFYFITDDPRLMNRREADKFSADLKDASRYTRRPDILKCVMKIRVMFVRRDDIWRYINPNRTIQIMAELHKEERIRFSDEDFIKAAMMLQTHIRSLLLKRKFLTHFARDVIPVRAPGGPVQQLRIFPNQESKDEVASVMIKKRARLIGEHESDVNKFFGTEAPKRSAVGDSDGEMEESELPAPVPERRRYKTVGWHFLDRNIVNPSTDFEDETAKKVELILSYHNKFGGELPPRVVEPRIDDVGRMRLVQEEDGVIVWPPCPDCRPERNSEDEPPSGIWNYCNLCEMRMQKQEIRSHFKREDLPAVKRYTYAGWIMQHHERQKFPDIFDKEEAIREVKEEAARIRIPGVFDVYNDSYSMNNMDSKTPDGYLDIPTDRDRRARVWWEGRPVATCYTTYRPLFTQERLHNASEIYGDCVKRLKTELAQLKKLGGSKETAKEQQPESKKLCVRASRNNRSLDLIKRRKPRESSSGVNFNTLFYRICEITAESMWGYDMRPFIEDKCWSSRHIAWRCMQSVIIKCPQFKSYIVNKGMFMDKEETVKFTLDVVHDKRRDDADKMVDIQGKIFGVFTRTRETGLTCL